MQRLYITEIETERDHWKEKCEGVVVENSQLKALYEELLKSTRALALLSVMRGPRAF